jgi:hypothetical protein
MKPDQKINLICRMAGNMCEVGSDRDIIVMKAFEIFDKVEEKVHIEESRKIAGIIGQENDQ